MVTLFAAKQYPPSTTEEVLLQQLEELRCQREPLQAKQQDILRKRDGYQSRLDQATREIEETQSKYAQECRASVDDPKANPQKHQDRIRQLEASISGLKTVIDELSTDSSALDDQIGKIAAQETGITFRIKDLELTREFEEAVAADREVDKLKTKSAARVVEASQRRAQHHHGANAGMVTFPLGVAHQGAKT